MRLFFGGGGPKDVDVMFGSSAPKEADAPPDGPDMARFVAPDPEERRLFREVVGGKLSGLADEATIEV